MKFGGFLRDITEDNKNDDRTYLKYISSSSCRTGSTDIPDPLSPLFPIVHRPRQVFRTTSRILT